MKQLKSSVEGNAANALPFVNACPVLSARAVAGAAGKATRRLTDDLKSGPSELNRRSCLPALAGIDVQPLVNSAVAIGGPAIARLVDTPLRSRAEPVLHAPCHDKQAPENIRTARELHDAVSEKLFATNLPASALARSPGADAPVREQAMALERLNRSALAEMRMMLFELQPEAMSSVPLPKLLHPAVDPLAGPGGVEITTDVDDSAPLCTARRCDVYRIATAPLSNTARHSAARHAHLQWRSALQGPAFLRVSDDGCGFVAEAGEPPDSGVDRVRKLASSLGADLVICSAPGAGAEVTLTFHRSAFAS